MIRTIPLALVFSVLAFGAEVAVGAVYKWIDEDGKVHFSDNPQDAERGEEIAYDSLNVLEGGEQLATSAEKNRERVLQQQEKAARTRAEAESRELYDPCTEDLDAYDKYSRVHQDSNGAPFYYYMENEDGTPMSQQEHNRVVSELESDLRRRGCL